MKPRPRLTDMIDLRHELAKLAELIDWSSSSANGPGSSRPPWDGQRHRRGLLQGSSTSSTPSTCGTRLSSPAG